MKALVLSLALAASSVAATGTILSTGKDGTAAPTRVVTHQGTAERIFLSADQRRQASHLAGWPADLRSLLPVRRQLNYGDYLWNDRGIPAAPTMVRVDLRTQLLSVIRGGHEIGSAVILYGADTKETPVGTFPVLWKGRHHRSTLYDAEMPYTLRLTSDGVAIHGSDVRWGAATHGCIGVPTEFAAKLFAAVPVGTPVTIVRSEEAPASASALG